MSITDSQLESDETPPPVSIGAVRLAVGLVWGLALYGLSKVPEAAPAFMGSTLGAHWGVGLGALWLALFLAPLVYLGSTWHLRRATLLWYIPVTVLLLLALGAYGVWRQTASVMWGPDTALLVPTAGALVFVAHHLVEGADHEGRIIASYPVYFDAAWKHAVQLGLTALFVGVFWLVLQLGAAMFDMVGVKAVRRIIQQSWFAAPTTTLMIAAGVHITDVRAGLVRGARTLGLTLLSWLLPIATALGAAFLLTLVFTGVQPLWDTRSATSILIAAAAGLGLLINATYKEGEDERNIVLRWAVRVASGLTLAFGALAAYALWLRIAQYGLTPERVFAAAILIVGAVYSLGYSTAAVWPGPWMRKLEGVNIAGAFLVIATILALFSPLADPARLFVDSQLARLNSRKVTAERFDFNALRWQGGRYGHDALTRLADRKDNPKVASAAKAVLAPDTSWSGEARATEAPVTAQEVSAKFSVYPEGRVLPLELFARTGAIEGDFRLRQCLRDEPKCAAAFTDLDGDGDEEILIAARAAVLVVDQVDGHWRIVGTIRDNCVPDKERFATGAFVLREPKRKYRDVEIDGRVMRVEELPALPTQRC